MEVWSRFRTSFSSLPTTSPSSSSPSSSASLDASLVLDVADELWFYKSVVSFPSLSVSCLPSLFSPAPESSTLIAQCMITDFSPSSQRSLGSSSSSSSSSSPQSAPDLKLPEPHLSTFVTAYDSLPAPPSIHEIYASTFAEYDEISYDDNECPYAGDYASSARTRDEDVYQCYLQDGEDDEGYDYYSAPSDWDDEDACHGYHVVSNGEDMEQGHTMKVEVLRADVPQHYPDNEPDSAFSGIYDMGAVLKDQHQRSDIASHACSRREAISRGSYLLRNNARSHREQKELKENLKLWARGVVSTLATRGRPLL